MGARKPASKATSTPASDVVLVAPLGSNPAHLISLVWALYVHRQLRVREARVILFASGSRYLERELLGPGAGLDQLHAEIGRSVMPPTKLHVRVPELDGRRLEDDAHAEEAQGFYDAVLAEGRAATARAGALPVVFALVGGSRRTLTVAATLVAQYLARPQDQLVDVRYTPKHAADVASTFLFPTQRTQAPLSVGDGRTVRPKDVEVEVVDVPFPRIGGLVKLGERATYREMLEEGQARIDKASSPELVIDLRLERPLASLVWPTGRKVRLRLGAPKILTLAALAVAQERGDPWLRAARANDTAASHPLVELINRCAGSELAKHEAITAFRAGPIPTRRHAEIDASLEKLRSDTVDALRGICARLDLPAATLVPLRDRRTVDGKVVSVQRLPCRSRVLLPASR